MKRNNKIIYLLLATVLMFSFTACGGTAEQPPQPDEQIQQNTEAPAEPETTPAEAGTPSAETEKDEETQPAENEAPAVSESTFDAQNAVVIEEVSGGVKYVFNVMPQNEKDMQALVDQFGLSDRHNTTAFFMAAYVRYAEDADDGLAMIDVVKGPQPLSDSEKAFIKERLADKKYLPKSYFEGATPENNYQPDSPWTIVVSDEAVSAPEGYSYTTVSSGGADSPRRVCLRIKGDSHYLWEYNGVLLGIRLPAEEDPWL